MIQRYAKWFSLLAAILLLLSVFLYNSRQMAQQAGRPLPERQQNTVAAEVEVITVSSGRYAPSVEAFGAAEPHFSLTLSAQVSGRVASLADNFESGRQIHQGDLLLQLEDSDYRAALASAGNDLASAEVDLLEAQREAAQARAEWEASGMQGEPDSPLVLHEPQVKAARAAVSNARAAVASARKDLQQTSITAPFDALIVSRSVAPGSYLQSGGEVATLYSTDRVEIPLSLSQRDWNNLPDISTLDQGDWPVTLTAVESGQQWQGYIRRAERHVDDSSRQQSLIAALDNPLQQSPVLAPGTFIRADIHGREVDNLWRLPPAALSQRGEIWYVDAGVLKKFATAASASDASAIYIRPPQALRNQSVQVLTHPLSSYMPGMAVKPVESEHE
ncbi:MAG: efflux RND transporter periplasmic adaptor subunit [Pseudomonadota bacterium]|nr:efflux RND transporter periplasmic adaptor subunit [Pseudomonadota bacterium]